MHGLVEWFPTWGTRTPGGTPEVFQGYAEGWLKLRLLAMVQKCYHFVCSVKEKMCFCNTFKFTQNILLLSKIFNVIRKRRDASP